MDSIGLLSSIISSRVPTDMGVPRKSSTFDLSTCSFNFMKKTLNWFYENTKTATTNSGRLTFMLYSVFVMFFLSATD